MAVDELEALQEKFDSLTIQNQRLAAQLDQVQETLDILLERVEDSPTRPARRSVSSTELLENDFVRINNPTPGRPDHATITGFTPTGLARLRLTDNTYSRRAKHNLTFVERD